MNAAHKNNAYNISLSDDVLRCEQQLDDNVNFQRITESNFREFSSKLATHNNDDSYLTSPAYYAFTGRRGLWICKKEDNFIPICWHPNTSGQLLIFLIDEERNYPLLSDVLNLLPTPPNGIKLVRIKNAFAQKAFPPKRAIDSGQFIFVPIIEKVLDWKYPVRILSTELVARMEGPDFRYIRNHVKQIETHAGIIESDLCKQIPSLKDFVHHWADQIVSSSSERHNYCEPYERILELLESGTFDAEGFIVRIKGNIESFTLWDISNSGKNRTANRFVNICNTNFRGLAEFNTVHMARLLVSQGINYVNIGGAETASLDKFKKKFMPIKNIQMCSVDIVVNESGFLPENFDKPTYWMDSSNVQDK